MYAQPVPTEISVPADRVDQRLVLKEHFNLLYVILSENKFIPQANFEDIGHGVSRSLSGIPIPYHNAVIGHPKGGNQEQFISQQINYFNTVNMPFVWYVDEDSSPQFKQLLLQRGFQDAGVFRGVIGVLDKPLTTPEIPADCVLECVNDEVAMEEFNELVCKTFAMEGAAKELYKKAMWTATNNQTHPMYHWVLRKQGKVVSAVSTLIHGEVASFWNGASLPEVRRKGLNTALRYHALQHAKTKGCRLGASYLMTEGLAFGICSKLGYETKWRFNVFMHK